MKSQARFRFALAIIPTLVWSVSGFGLMDRRESLANMAASLSLPSLFITESNFDSSVSLDFSGVYRDPKHPKGYRVIRSSGPGTINVDVQDQPNGPKLSLIGTSTYDSTSKKTNLQVEVPNKDGTRSVLQADYSDQLLYVNFCENGEVLTMGSIMFPDGNIWIKDNGLQGVYVDTRFPGSYRIVRELGNAKAVIEVANRADQLPVILPAVINKADGTLVVDFSPLSGPKRLPAKIDGNQLTFQDATTWTKL
jgi:hypothetical protein